MIPRVPSRPEGRIGGWGGFVPSETLPLFFTVILVSSQEAVGVAEVFYPWRVLAGFVLQAISEESEGKAPFPFLSSLVLLCYKLLAAKRIREIMPLINDKKENVFSLGIIQCHSDEYFPMTSFFIR